MLSSFIITFRETLEAALIVGIILSYLAKTDQTRYNNVLYISVISGIFASIIGAILFKTLAGGFSGKAEKIFESFTMLVGAVLLTTMILWMMKQKHVALEIESKVAQELTKTYKFGLYTLVFIAILREGIETIIFLYASILMSSGNTMLGALSGIIAAIFLGFAIFAWSKKVNIKRFFNVTSVLLIFFAAGLTAHGAHELQESGIIPTVIEHIWDINPKPNPDGTYPFFHENGYIGGIFKSLFGYNGNPSLFEVISYSIYLVIVYWLWKTIDRPGVEREKRLALKIPL